MSAAARRRGRRRVPYGNECFTQLLLEPLNSIKREEGKVRAEALRKGKMADYQRSVDRFAWEVACWRYNRLISEGAMIVVPMIKGKLFKSYSWIIFQVIIFGDLMTFAMSLTFEIVCCEDSAFYSGDMLRDVTINGELRKYYGPRSLTGNSYMFCLVPNTFLDCVHVRDLEYRQTTMSVCFGEMTSRLTFAPVQVMGSNGIKHLDGNKMNLDANTFFERVSEIRRMYDDILRKVFMKRPFVPSTVVQLMGEYLVITSE
ncbi:MAG: hypothetical protein Harvfovirus26_3 [Harvfovirus sp.]|uniref:Uncharacterized protein n=1 Tax=Harvfovirus sp. TaxID=2487768 RepID=A0A3G5A273_9VIRU|nr:MAG: hypothetical protein Harvfovirus26_3 [Harvfovirus sp.]